MKITIYTVTDCQFSKKEIEYLKSHNLQFEEKNLETNKEFLTEMLAISDNFAGTPVTKIEKDDGSSVVLKGFTQSEFDEALGYKVTEPVVEQKDAVLEQPGVVEPPAVVSPTSGSSPPVNSDLSSTPPTPPAPNPMVDLGNLQSPVSATSVSPQPPVVEPPTQLTQDPTQPITPPTQPSAAPVVEPPKAPEDPKLASVLSNLQNMSTDPVPPPTSNTSPITQPASELPSIPDPKFG